MKVLWLSNLLPSIFTQSKVFIGGWQDSLERIVLRNKEIQLAVAFNVSSPQEEKIIDGVRYFPLYSRLSWLEKQKSRISAYPLVEKSIQQAIKIIEAYQPDLIQVFGTEFGFGMLQKYTDIPVVIHIQGAMIPYDNAKNPPGYNEYTYFKAVKGNPFRILNHSLLIAFRNSRVKMEREVWKYVRYYMGRTNWDYAVSNVLHPNREYFHVEEALRPEFLSEEHKWKLYVNKDKIRLISIGCSTLWKGLDMMLKTARLLYQMGIEFVWNVVGKMPNEYRILVEYQERITFKESGINILGMTPPGKLVELLCNSDIYVHTAYAENSPNSICEAQAIGLPIVSTNVGGIPSLVHNGIDGILVPANDPFQMANAIYELSKDQERMKLYSYNSYVCAHQRHNEERIGEQLFNCYESIIDSKI